MEYGVGCVWRKKRCMCMKEKVRSNTEHQENAGVWDSWESEES